MATQRSTRQPTTLFVYLAVVLALGAALLLGSWIAADPSDRSFPLKEVAFWWVLSLAAETLWLPTRTREGTISMSLAVNFATLFVLPLPQVLSVGALSVGLSDRLLRRREWTRTLFNASQTVIALAASLLVLRLLGGLADPIGSRTFLAHPWTTLAAALTFFVVNTFLVTRAISLHGGRPFWRTWRENYGFRYHLIITGILFIIALGLVIVAGNLGYIARLLSVLLLLLLRNHYRCHVAQKTVHETSP